MRPLILVGFIALGIFSLRGTRWAYITFVFLGLLFFPASVEFRLNPQACEFAINGPLALFSLTNYGHIWRFALFFAMTSAQLRMDDPRALAWSALATIVMGAAVELAEGITGSGHCRLRDLVPDSAGALLGATLVFFWRCAIMSPRRAAHLER